MNKFLILIFSVLLFPIFWLNVEAKTCEQTGDCGGNYGNAGCYRSNPGGASTCNTGYCSSSVNGDTNSAKYCSNRQDFNNVLTIYKDSCSTSRQTFSACRPGSGPIALATGDLYVYSGVATYVNGGYFGANPGGSLVGKVTKGQGISISIAQGGYTNSPGWMYDESPAYGVGAGQIITSSQNWGDDYTDYGYIYNYETYDYNDASVVLGIKPEIINVECDNATVNLSANPASVKLETDTNVSLTGTATVALQNYRSISNTLSPGQAFNCTWGSIIESGLSKSVNCSVNSMYPNTSVTWTHQWCTGTCAKTCTKSITIPTTLARKACEGTPCNVSGCTAGNSCNASTNVCQTICPIGHTRYQNCNCQPPCSNLSYTFSQNSCALTATGFGASAYVQNIRVNGAADSMPVTMLGGTSFQHTINSAGTKSWTITWEERASVGTAPAVRCSTIVTHNIPAPSCGDVNLAVAPSIPIWGEQVVLTAKYIPPAVNPPTYDFVSSTHTAMTNCSGNPFNLTTQPIGENCTLPWINTTPKTFDWLIRWQTTDTACTALVNNTCNKPLQITGNIHPGYMKTTNGVSYINGINNQPSFNTDKPDSFSSVVFGSKTVGPTNQIPTCAGDAFFCTTKNYLLLGYSDSNTIALPSSWYRHFQALNDSPKVNIVPGASTLGAVMASPQLSSTIVNLVNVTGDFTVSGEQCRYANVFLISGNLIITPNLTLADSTTSGCLFIVAGNTIIRQGTTVSQTCNGGASHIDLTSDASPTANIHAFIITEGFSTDANPISKAQLMIKGGLITNNITGGLNRNINSDMCLFPNLPSEVIDYEGARYIKLFRDVLSDPALVSVREIQYTGQN